MFRLLVLLFSFISISGYASIDSPSKEYYNYHEDLYIKYKPQFNNPRNLTEWECIRSHVLRTKDFPVIKHKQNKYDKILNGLYVGSKKCLNEVIKSGKVDRIISFTSGKHRVVPRSFKGQVVTIFKHDCKTTNMGKIFNKHYKFMMGAKKGLLIHCAAGHSRSSSLCILYIMDQYNVPYSIAQHYVKICRPSIGPNKWFVKQLQEIDFHRTLYKQKYKD